MMKGEATDRPIILTEEKYAVTKLKVACCENVTHRDLRDSPAKNLTWSGSDHCPDRQWMLNSLTAGHRPVYYEKHRIRRHHHDIIGIKWRMSVAACMLWSKF